MKTSTLMMMAAVALVGCGVSETEVTENDTLDTDGAELSATSRTYVTVQHDMRKCASPMCGGWWVTDVNRKNPTPKYVWALDFSKSGLDEATIEQAQGGDVVLRGKLGAGLQGFPTYPSFVVSDAWRGMPGVTAGKDFFFVKPVNIQCFKAPCPTLKATRLNAGGSTLADGLNVEAAALTRVDQTWLNNRVREHDAIVTGTFNAQRVLDATQVFVKLPEQPGPCPLMKMPACASGKVRTYARNADRCVLPGACVIPGVCAYYVPSCDEGYTLQSWSGGAHACPVHACDPTFSLPVPQ